MTKALQNIKQHAGPVYQLGLFLVLIGLPLARISVSLGMICLILAWVLDGNYIQKLKHLLANPAPLWFCGIWLVHAVWLAFSQDFAFGVKSIKTNMALVPFFIVPATMAPVSANRLNQLRRAFITAVVVAILIGFGKYSLQSDLNYDLRYLSPFVSHIRLSLMIAVSIILIVRFELMPPRPLGVKIASGSIVLLMLFFLGFGAFLTGWIALIIVSLTMGIFFIRKSLVRSSIILTGLCTIVITILFITQEYENYYQPEVPIEHSDESALGVAYEAGYFSVPAYENGYRVDHYIAWPELTQSWNNLGLVSFDGRDNQDQLISGTLIRYMTSKGLKKDEKGFMQLSEQDIEHIVAGVANIRFLKNQPLRNRLYNIFWQWHNYKTGLNPERGSTIMRIVYWQIGWELFKGHPILGVGTGGQKLAFSEYYHESMSNIEGNYRNRAHNQYLTFLLCFGLVGFTVISFCVVQGVRYLKPVITFTSATFGLTALLSFLSEDTIETQIGLAFCTLPFALFLKRD